MALIRFGKAAIDTSTIARIVDGANLGPQSNPDMVMVIFKGEPHAVYFYNEDMTALREFVKSLHDVPTLEAMREDD